MKIAILGTRGVPANYGGFETFAEECAAGLVARGHRVAVYGRAHYIPRELHTHRGIDLVVLPTIRLKYLDTVAHTFLSILHALPGQYDVILICNAANSIYAWLPRCIGTPVVVNVDGIERLRSKWNWLGKKYYHLCEYLSTIFASEIVTDARVIEEYYRENYGKKSVFIPYGAILEKPQGSQQLEALDLQSGGYFLYVSRLEPENNAHIVIAAFERVRTRLPLVVVGDAPYAGAYIRSLRRTKDHRIRFPGAIYGKGYRQLLANARCYIHATEVGGTHPALIEAMGLANIIIANETPENCEVLGKAGMLYHKNDVDELAARLQQVADAPENFERLKQAAHERARDRYSWDEVVLEYEKLFQSMVRR